MIEKKGKRARSKNAIMHAAKELFEEKGINHVTFNDIAERADMCRTTIFNYFSTINELMLTLAEQEAKEVVEYCNDTGRTGRELVETLFEMLIKDAAKYPNLSVKLLTNSLICEQSPKAFLAIEELLIANLPEGLTDEQKEEKVILLTGAYYGLVNHYLINEKNFNVRKLQRQMNQFVDRFYA